MAGSKRELSALSSDLGGYWAPSGAAEGGKQDASSTVAKTTQFYAGDRVEIDASFLEKFTDIPRIQGTPGNPDFRVRFDSSERGATLEQLQAARRSWDEHLSKIPEASKRLHACVELFFHSEERSLPLFFPGDGALADVISLHTSVDATAMSGPPLGRPLSFCKGERVFLPKTLLGHYVDEFLLWAFMGYEEQCNYCSTDELKQFVGRLIDAGGSDIVAPFFEPLEKSFVSSLSFFSSGGGTFGQEASAGIHHKAGDSAVKGMKDFGWFLEHCSAYGRMDEMAWLVGKLEAKMAN